MIVTWKIIVQNFSIFQYDSGALYTYHSDLIYWPGIFSSNSRHWGGDNSNYYLTYYTKKSFNNSEQQHKDRAAIYICYKIWILLKSCLMYIILRHQSIFFLHIWYILNHFKWSDIKSGYWTVNPCLAKCWWIKMKYLITIKRLYLPLLY